MARKPAVHESTGNVFADLKLPRAADLPVQAELTRLIFLRIRQLKLTQSAAAGPPRHPPARRPKLMNARHTGFSAKRLFRFLNALDQDVQITVRNRPLTTRRPATTRVAAA